MTGNPLVRPLYRYRPGKVWIGHRLIDLDQAVQINLSANVVDPISTKMSIGIRVDYGQGYKVEFSGEEAEALREYLEAIPTTETEAAEIEARARTNVEDGE